MAAVELTRPEVAAKVSELARLEAEKKRRRIHEAIRYYSPHEKQEAFHRAPNRVRSFLGGNRAGKTTAGCAEDVAFFEGERLWLPEDDPDRIVRVDDGEGGRIPVKRAARILIAAESFGTHKKVTLPKLLGNRDKGEPGLLRAGTYETKKNQTGVVEWIGHKERGSEFFLMSYDQDPAHFEGIDFDAAHFDEPPIRAIWIAVRRGLVDRLGPAWFTMTPLKEPWIYDEVTSKAENFTIYVDTRENVGHGLSAQGYQEFADDLTDDEKEARLRGRFMHLTGLVYKSYDSKVHHIKREDVPLEEHWGYYMHVDPHPRKPHCAVWIAVRPDSSRIVIGELKNSCRDNLVSSFAESIKVYENRVLGIDGRRVERLIDPLSQTPSPTEKGLTILQEFAEYGLHFRIGSKNREAAINLLRKDLHFRPKTGIRPMIYFFDDLELVHFEMTHYVFEEHGNTKAAQNKPAPGTPKKIHDDFIEGIHRILLDDPQCPDFEDEDFEAETPMAHGRAVGY